MPQISTLKNASNTLLRKIRANAENVVTQKTYPRAKLTTRTTNVAVPKPTVILPGGKAAADAQKRSELMDKFAAQLAAKKATQKAQREVNATPKPVKPNSRSGALPGEKFVGKEIKDNKVKLSYQDKATGTTRAVEHDYAEVAKNPGLYPRVARPTTATVPVKKVAAPKVEPETKAGLTQKERELGQVMTPGQTLLNKSTKLKAQVKAYRAQNPSTNLSDNEIARKLSGNTSSVYSKKAAAVRQEQKNALPAHIQAQIDDHAAKIDSNKGAIKDIRDRFKAGSPLSNAERKEMRESISALTATNQDLERKRQALYTTPLNVEERTVASNQANAGTASEISYIEKQLRQDNISDQKRADLTRKLNELQKQPGRKNYNYDPDLQEASRILDIPQASGAEAKEITKKLGIDYSTTGTDSTSQLKAARQKALNVVAQGYKTPAPEPGTPNLPNQDAIDIKRNIDASQQVAGRVYEDRLKELRRQRNKLARQKGKKYNEAKIAAIDVEIEKTQKAQEGATKLYEAKQTQTERHIDAIGALRARRTDVKAEKVAEEAKVRATAPKKAKSKPRLTPGYRPSATRSNTLVGKVGEATPENTLYSTVEAPPDVKYSDGKVTQRQAPTPPDGAVPATTSQKKARITAEQYAALDAQLQEVIGSNQKTLNDRLAPLKQQLKRASGPEQEDIQRKIDALTGQFDAMHTKLQSQYARMRKMPPSIRRDNYLRNILQSVDLPGSYVGQKSATGDRLDKAQQILSRVDNVDKELATDGYTAFPGVTKPAKKFYFSNGKLIDPKTQKIPPAELAKLEKNGRYVVIPENTDYVKVYYKDGKYYTNRPPGVKAGEEKAVILSRSGLESKLQAGRANIHGVGYTQAPGTKLPARKVPTRAKSTNEIAIGPGGLVIDPNDPEGLVRDPAVAKRIAETQVKDLDRYNLLRKGGDPDAEDRPYQRFKIKNFDPKRLLNKIEETPIDELPPAAALNKLYKAGTSHNVYDPAARKAALEELQQAKAHLSKLTARELGDKPALLEEVKNIKEALATPQKELKKLMQQSVGLTGEELTAWQVENKKAIARLNSSIAEREDELQAAQAALKSSGRSFTDRTITPGKTEGFVGRKYNTDSTGNPVVPTRTKPGKSFLQSDAGRISDKLNTREQLLRLLEQADSIKTKKDFRDFTENGPFRQVVDPGVANRLESVDDVRNALLDAYEISTKGQRKPTISSAGDISSTGRVTMGNILRNQVTNKAGSLITTSDNVVPDRNQIPFHPLSKEAKIIRGIQRNVVPNTPRASQTAFQELQSIAANQRKEKGKLIKNNSTQFDLLADLQDKINEAKRRYSVTDAADLAKRKSLNKEISGLEKQLQDATDTGGDALKAQLADLNTQYDRAKNSVEKAAIEKEIISLQQDAAKITGNDRMSQAMSAVNTAAEREKFAERTAKNVATPLTSSLASVRELTSLVKQAEKASPEESEKLGKLFTEKFADLEATNPDAAALLGRRLRRRVEGAKGVPQAPRLESYPAANIAKKPTSINDPRTTEQLAGRQQDVAAKLDTATKMLKTKQITGAALNQLDPALGELAKEIIAENKSLGARAVPLANHPQIQRALQQWIKRRTNYDAKISSTLKGTATVARPDGTRLVANRTNTLYNLQTKQNRLETMVSKLSAKTDLSNADQAALVKAKADLEEITNQLDAIKEKNFNKYLQIAAFSRNKKAKPKDNEAQRPNINWSKISLP